MANAITDQNFVPTRLGVLFSDGVTVVPITCAESNSSAMKVNTVDTISVTWLPMSQRDDNFRECMTFVGSDGLSYPWAVDADGKILIDM